jgi:type VI secretion system protein ImpF
MPAAPDASVQNDTERLSGSVADRLWPVLLDRLTDLEPDRKKESTQARTMSRQSYRDSVLRDLQWLLNTTNLDAEIDFSGYADAQRSVVDYGVAALSGRFAADIDTQQLQAVIRQAIIQFEPRLLPHTVEVSVVAAERSLDMHNVLSVSIRGDLWSVPYPLEVLLRSDIDLETGHVALREQSKGD